MAMLAEPKRKQKYSVDPRNLGWSNDDNKFGQKLMEKMGWQKGKGLGANEDGNVDHIKVRVKNDSVGLGCTKADADSWVAHQDDFNALLSSLNSSVTEEEEKPKVQSLEPKVQNLEELSKSLKGRIHYKRFARGKDLTNARNEDLNCIFGRRKSKSAPSTPQNQSAVNSDEEESGNVSVSHGVTVIKSVTSVQDYFKQKMAAKMKNAQRSSMSEPSSPSRSASDRSQALDEKENNCDGDSVVPEIFSSGEEEKKKKKSSKKKSKDSELLIDSGDGDEKANQSADTETDKPDSEQINDTKRKRKKKSKKSSKDKATDKEESDSAASNDNSLHFVEKEEKKQLVENESTCNDSKSVKSKKKKSKKRDRKDENDQSVDEAVCDEAPKKKRKRDRTDQ